MSPATRILIADKFPVVRAGLRHILESNSSWQVVAEARDGLEAVSKAVETRPDIAILGHSLPLLNGVTATTNIRQRVPETEVLIYATRTSEALIRDALEAGVRGYLLKSDSNDRLIAAVEALVEHKPFFTAMASDVLRKSVHKDPREGGLLLSGRERAVLQLVAEGRTSREIALILDISLKTVESHRTSLMRKLNASSTVELVRYAVRNRIVEA